MGDDDKFVIREREPGLWESVRRDVFGEPEKTEQEVVKEDTGEVVTTIREKEPGLWQSVVEDITGEKGPREKEILDRRDGSTKATIRDGVITTHGGGGGYAGGGASGGDGWLIRGIRFLVAIPVALVFALPTILIWGFLALCVWIAVQQLVTGRPIWGNPPGSSPSSTAAPRPTRDTLLTAGGVVGQLLAVRIFNCDDACRVLLDGREVASVGFGDDSGVIDITSSVGRYATGESSGLTFQNINEGGAVTYGFQVLRNGVVVDEQICGTVFQIGCKDNVEYVSGVAVTWEITVGRIGDWTQPAPASPQPAPKARPYNQRQQAVVAELTRVAQLQRLFKERRGSYYCSFECLENPRGCFPDGPYPELGANLNFRRLGYRLMMFGGTGDCSSFVFLATGDEPSFCVDTTGQVCEARETLESEDRCPCILPAR